MIPYSGVRILPVTMEEDLLPRSEMQPQGSRWSSATWPNGVVSSDTTVGKTNVALGCAGAMAIRQDWEKANDRSREASSSS